MIKIMKLEFESEKGLKIELAVLGLLGMVAGTVLALYANGVGVSPFIAQLCNLFSSILMFGGLFCWLAIPFRTISFGGAANSKDNEAHSNIGLDSAQSEEEVELRRKLNIIIEKEKGIKKLLTKGLKKEKADMLNEAHEFLESQKLIVTTRLLVFDYLAWEDYALIMCQKMTDQDYLTGSNTDFAGRVIKEIISKGETLEQAWKKLEKTGVTATVEQILPRVIQILKTCRELLDEIENSEIAGVLKDVRQLEANSIPLLPESSTLEAVRILQEFQERPLNQDLLFEHLRIKSLKEINNI